MLKLWNIDTALSLLFAVSEVQNMNNKITSWIQDYVSFIAIESPLLKFDCIVICYRIAFASHPQFIEQTRNASFKTLSDPKYCGKMKVLRGLLSVFHKERCKVLLFSLSTKVGSKQLFWKLAFHFKKQQLSQIMKPQMAGVFPRLNNERGWFISEMFSMRSTCFFICVKCVSLSK